MNKRQSFDQLLKRQNRQVQAEIAKRRKAQLHTKAQSFLYWRMIRKPLDKPKP